MKNPTYSFLLFLFLMLSSCISLNTIHNGRTLGKEHVEIALVANTGDTSRYLNVLNESSNDLNLELDISFGATERLDVGAKINLSGTGALYSKFQYLGSKTSLLASSIAVEGGINVLEPFLGDYSYYGAVISYNSIHFSEKFCLIANPKYVFARYIDNDYQTGDRISSESEGNLLLSYGFIVGTSARFGLEVTHRNQLNSRPEQIGCSLSFVF